MAFKLSIVTINYNNSDGLKKTIESVLSQTFENFEFIIIDGGSTDGSIESIREFENNIDYWVSEKDNGIYNAMNKGMRVANGEYFFFLNSGDFFVGDDILEKVIPYLDGTDIVYGDLLIAETNARWIKKYDHTICFFYFTYDTLPHQGSFISRNILSKFNLSFSESLKIASDWKFFLDAICKYDATLKYLNFLISEYNTFGLSALKENRALLLLEKQSVLESEYYRFYLGIEGFYELKNNYNRLINSRFIKVYSFVRSLLYNPQ